MNKEFSKLCTPAKIYFVLAVIACIIALFNGFGVVAVVIKLIFAFIWTFILGWLCDKGFKALSWFLVLIPYIIILLVLLGMMSSGMMKNYMYGGMANPMSYMNYGMGSYGMGNYNTGSNMMMREHMTAMNGKKMYNKPSM